MSFRPFLAVGICTILLASCGGSMELKSGKLINQSEFKTYNVGTSDRYWVHPLNNGDIVTVAMGVDDLIHVTKLTSRLQEQWKLTIPATNTTLDVVNIHELDSKLIIPVSIVKEGGDFEEVRGYGYHSVDLASKATSYTELDVKGPEEVSLGLPGETTPRAVGFRHEAFEAELGDQKLVFSPSRAYSMTYRYDPYMDTVATVHVSVFDRNLKPVWKQKIEIPISDEEQIMGARIDNDGAVIILLQSRLPFYGLRKFSTGGRAKRPIEESGEIRALKYMQGKAPVSVSTSLGLKEVYALTMEVGSDDKLYVAGLSLDDSRINSDFEKVEAVTLEALTISSIDFKTAKAVNAVHRIDEDTLDRFFDKEEFLNGAIDRLIIDQANNRVLLLVEETGVVTTKFGFHQDIRNTAARSLLSGQSTGSQELEKRMNARQKTRDLVCGNIYVFGFDLEGKLVWQQGIKKDQRQRPALGYYGMGFFNTITPERTLALMYVQRGLQFQEFDILSGKKVTEKTIADFSGMHSFVPSLTRLLPKREFLSVMYLGAFSEGVLYRVGIQ